MQTAHIKTDTAVATLKSSIAKIVKEGSLLGSKTHEGIDGEINRRQWLKCEVQIAAMFELAAKLGILSDDQAYESKREAHNKMVRNFDRNYTNREKRQQNA